MKRNLTCIICPRGCSMTACVQGQQVTVTAEEAAALILQAVNADLPIILEK